MKFASLEVTPPLGTAVVVCAHDLTLSIGTINGLQFENDENLTGPVISGSLTYRHKSHFVGGADDSVWLVTKQDIQSAIADIRHKIIQKQTDFSISRREEGRLNALLQEYNDIDAVTARLMEEAGKVKLLSFHHKLGTTLFSVNSWSQQIQRGPVRKVVHIGGGSFCYETGCQQRDASYFTTLKGALDHIAGTLQPHLRLVRKHVQVTEAVSESEGRRRGWFDGG